MSSAREALAHSATVAPASAGGSLEALGQITPESLTIVPPSVYVQLDEFARGGLGRIIRARDTRSGRIVAIKEMLSSTEDAALRFAREAMITANLQHPAIVPVYEVGRWTNGQPFYAMKLVSGRPLDQVIAATKTIDDRLALVSHVLAVADALAYAHGERVIHRDLKPHNVLVGAHGETVVIDWGLARRLDEGDSAAASHRVISAVPGQTYIGAIMGTPAYMPPEQARGVRVDERADVYAIGAILYHLLAGRPPYTGKTLDELLAKVKAGKLERLATVDPSIPADLAAIVEHAMAREPAERYSSAHDLAADLRRFTTGQLVRAHRYTRTQRLARFVSRNRAAVLIGTIAVIGGLVGGTIAVRNVMTARDEATRSQARAEDARDEAQTRLVEAHVDRARSELAAGHDQLALAFTIAAAEASQLDDRLRFIAGRALASQIQISRHADRTLSSMAMIPGSVDTLIGGGSGLARWNPVTGQIVWKQTSDFAGDIYMLDAKTAVAAREHGIEIVDVDTGAVSATLVATPKVPFQGMIGMDATRRWLAAPQKGGTVALFDLATRSFVTNLPSFRVDHSPLISANAERFALVAAVSQVQSRMYITDRSGAFTRELCGNCAIARAFGDEIIFAEVADKGGPATIKIADWNGVTKKVLSPSTSGDVADLLALPDHQHFAFVMTNGTIELHDRSKGMLWRRTMGERGNTLHVDRFGRMWVLGNYRGVHAFDAMTGMPLGRWFSGGQAIEMSSDGKRLVVLRLGEGVVSWEVQISTMAVAPTPARVRKLVFLDRDRYVTGSEDGTVAAFDRGSMRVIGRHDAKVSNLEVVGGTKVLSSGRDGKTYLRDFATGAEIAHADVGPFSTASPDGTQFILGAANGEVFTWDGKGAPVKLARMPGAVVALRWSPDGTKFAAADELGQIDVWTRERVPIRTIPPAKSTALDVTFSPSGTYVALSFDTEQETLYSLVPGKPDIRLDPAIVSPHYSLSYLFSRDESSVAIAGTGFVAMWDLPSGKIRHVLESGLDSLVLAATKDERFLISGGADRQARVWDAKTGLEVTSASTPNEVYGLSMSPEGDRLAVLTLGSGMIWDITPFAGTLDELKAIAACRIEVAVVNGAITRRSIDAAACNAR